MNISLDFSLMIPELILAAAAIAACGSAGGGRPSAL